MAESRSKKIVLLGATGSIGRQTLAVCRRLKYRLEAISCGSDIDLAYQQIEEFKPRLVAVSDPQAGQKLEDKLKSNPALTGVKVLASSQGIVDLVSLDYDLLVMAISGFAAMKPMLEAIKLGKTIAMANKEVVVGAGEFILPLAEARGAKIYPVDSEPSAIWQAVRGEAVNPIKRVLLTASGGPFREWPAEDFNKIRPADALKHPVWSMGRKITVDSASMMNKGLEMIEICRLFKLKPDQVEVLVHPQGILHSAVEFKDGAVIGQMGLPDMELPIQYALTYPQRAAMPDKPALDLSEICRLNFSRPDDHKFPALGLARRAMEAGGALPAVLNAANELAVEAFLAEKIKFTDMAVIIKNSLDQYSQEHLDLPQGVDDILAADDWARAFARDQVKAIMHNNKN